MNATNRTLFTLPTIGDNEVLRTHPFGIWLLSQEARHINWLDAFDDWAKSLGFNMEKHFCEEKVFDQCKNVFECVWCIWWKVKNVIKLEDWLTPCLGCDHEAFYIRGWDKSTYCQLNGDAVKFINTNFKDSLIYALDPKDYYFEIQNNGLYIKYQSILGQRLIAGMGV
jgi:hypothetical protein